MRTILAMAMSFVLLFGAGASPASPRNVTPIPRLAKAVCGTICGNAESTASCDGGQTCSCDCGRTPVGKCD